MRFQIIAISLWIVAASGCRYVAIGDSVGSPAEHTYVNDVADATDADTMNLSTPGEYLPLLEYRLKTDQGFRAQLAAADPVTLSIGGNDLMTGFQPYIDGNCGGADGQDCLRTTVRLFTIGYPRFLSELRGITRARVIALNLYDPFATKVDATVRGYLAEVNRVIDTDVCAQPDMAVANVALAFNGPDGTADPASKGYVRDDGIHPSQLGQAVIAVTVRDAHC